MAYVDLDDEQQQRLMVPGLEPSADPAPPAAPAPTTNPRDAIVARDAGSWEQALKEAGGSLFDPSDLQGVIRQVSYAQNAGQDPQQFLNQAISQYDTRRAPTASAGGSGGDADVNGDGRLDLGWAQNPNGQVTRAIAARQAPSFAFPSAMGAGQQSFNVNAPGSQFSDPYTKLLENLATQQLEALRQPQSNPQLDQLLAFLQKRFGDLSGSPGYSPEQQALLRTQALDPIEADRAASQRRSTERTASRGMLPSSGLAELDSRDVDMQYDKVRAAAQRDLGVNAINRQDQDLAQALMIGQLAGITIPGHQRTEDTQRRNEMLGTANLLYNLPRQAMYDANNVVNGSPGPTDVFSNAVQLLQSQQNQQAINNQQNSAYWASLGELFENLF